MGSVILSWSHLEISINLVIQTIYDHWDGENVESKIPNVQIKRKIKFLRRWYNLHPEIATTHDWLLGILDYVSVSSRIRGAIAHGIIRYDLRLEWQDIQEASFATFSADRDKNSRETSAINIEQLHCISRLNLCLMQLFEELAIFLMREANLDDHFSSLGEKLSILLRVLDDISHIFEEFRTNN